MCCVSAALPAALFYSTLTKTAAKCGCPIVEDGYLSFSTKIYGRVYDPVGICQSATAGAAATPVQASAGWLQAGLKAYSTQYGVRECKGSVEYTYATTPAAGSPKPGNDVTYVKAGQMIVRMLVDK